MTEDKLYELDRDELITVLESKLEITISEDEYNADLFISSQSTADGYEIYTITDGTYNALNPEWDVFYYEPSAEEILKRLEQLDPGDKVQIEEMEWLDQDEGAIIDFLLLNYSEDYDEIHEIIKESGE